MQTECFSRVANGCEPFGVEETTSDTFTLSLLFALFNLALILFLSNDGFLFHTSKEDLALISTGLQVFICVFAARL